MFTRPPYVRLCPVLVTIGMAVSPVGCGQNESPTRPAQLSGAATSDTGSVLASTSGSDPTVGPELAAVRRATARFHDTAAAYAAGYTTENEPCVASPLGAMGIHAPNFALLGDPALDAAQPELLLYAPTSNGGFKLTGVEYFRAALLRNLVTGEVGPRFESQKWDPAQYELVTPQPQLLGQGFELDPPPAPGVPWHWSLHVWIWAHNPSGMFSPWNPSISCG